MPEAPRLAPITAAQLGEITSQIAEHKDQASYAGTAARLRLAAAAFGAR